LHNKLSMRYLLLFLLLSPALLIAQTKAAGTGTSNNAVGTISWSNPGNITGTGGSDNSRATTSATNGTTQYIQGTNFGFSLAATDVIAGIELNVEKSSVASNVSMITTGSLWPRKTGSGLAVPKPAGSNRCMVVIIGIENSTAPRSIGSVTYGGQALTQVTGGVADIATPFYARTEVWYLLEAGIAASSGTNLTYTFAGGSTPGENFEILTAAIYNNVDQTSPLVDTEIAATSSTNATYNFPNALTVDEGGMAIFGIFCGNPSDNSNPNNDVAGFSIPTGYTERVNYEGANTGFSTSGGHLMVVERAFTADGTTQPQFVFDGNPNRRTIVGISLRRMRNQDSNVRLRKAVVNYVGNNLISGTQPDWSNTDEIITYGGPANLWGTSWSVLDVNNTSFGAGLSATIANGSLRVDHMTIRIYTTSVLPVELVSFNAQQKGNGVTCSWITASERDTDKFFMERSSDGVNFEPVGMLPAAGNSTQAISYEFRDEHPLNGVSYYRLTTKDTDGATTKSDIVSVNYSASGEVTIFPNPASDWTTIMATEGFDEIIISNMNGQIIDRIMGTSLQTEQKLNIQDMPDGTYFVCVKSHDGTVQIQKLTITSRGF